MNRTTWLRHCPNAARKAVDVAMSPRVFGKSTSRHTAYIARHSGNELFRSNSNKVQKHIFANFATSLKEKNVVTSDLTSP